MAEQKSEGIRSAYELAMDRLRKKDGPGRALTMEQKKRIAQIDDRAKARIAEAEILFGGSLATARAAGDSEKVRELEANLRTEIRRAREEAESEKESVRGEADAAR